MENHTGKIITINSCKFCGKVLKDEWNYCPYCKSPVETFICDFCGNGLKAHWKFCPHCKNEAGAGRMHQQKVDKCNDWLREILKK